MTPPKKQVTIITGVLYDDAKQKTTLDEETVQQEQLNSKETQYLCHAETFNDK